jgi:hypothetical protein
MTEGEQPDPQTLTGVTGYWRYWRADAIGCLSFIACFALCLIATALITEFALRDVGRSEVSDALYHAQLMGQWCCGGGVVSLAVSALVARVCVRWAK